ncbi:MAG: methionine gamma-lyase family protein [Erysipelotrichaceae bacterium]|nr:methionine gamma-lyase family protein [Erysipelotrichaceae bacterium]
MISDKIITLTKEAETKLKKIYQEQEEIEFFNSSKVLNAFKEHNVTEDCFNMTTGYGYNDLGRDTIEKVYSTIFKSEDSLVRSQFISGTHALSTALFACLRPGDIMLSISGKPYDTLEEVIGIRENNSSLKSYGIKYQEIELINDDFNYDEIKKILTENKIKLIEIQRSKGYSTRKSITIEKLEKVIHFIKKIDKDVIIMIDNCYCEFVTTKEPIEVGADLVVGSLIKNLGAGMVSNGAYITGRKDLITLCAERLNVAGEGKEVGPSLGMNKQFLIGLYMAPSVVCASIKTAILTSYLLEKLGYEVEPKYHDKRADIVQNIIFKNKEKLIQYCQAIQASSPIDANVLPIPWDMPGYLDQVIMAAGTFTQGSSIELSCDGPIREPYIAYQQGSLTYSYGKIAIMNAVSRLLETNSKK